MPSTSKYPLAASWSSPRTIGSGKTTLLRAILGLVPADDGEIIWRGVVVGDVASFMMPPRAAYTPQTLRLFSMSLRDNLLLGHED